jgi:transcriptional regulator with XRE-family HTH domain
MCYNSYNVFLHEVSDMNEVLQKIQTLMDEREWSLYKLAQKSGIPYSSLSSLFRKDNQPTISSLEKICAGFHITLSEFFASTPPIGKSPTRSPRMSAPLWITTAGSAGRTKRF